MAMAYENSSRRHKVWGSKDKIRKRGTNRNRKSATKQELYSRNKEMKIDLEKIKKLDLKKDDVLVFDEHYFNSEAVKMICDFLKVEGMLVPSMEGLGVLIKKMR